MRLPRRMALLIGMLTALVALFAWRESGRAELPALLAIGVVLLAVAGLIRPRDQAGRTRVVLAWGVYTLLVLAGLGFALFLGSGAAIAGALAFLLAVAVGMTVRAAYQAPRRRERIYARYLKSSSVEPFQR